MKYLSAVSRQHFTGQDWRRVIAQSPTATAQGKSQPVNQLPSLCRCENAHPWPGQVSCKHAAGTSSKREIPGLMDRHCFEGSSSSCSNNILQVESRKTLLQTEIRCSIQIFHGEDLCHNKSTLFAYINSSLPAEREQQLGIIKWITL